MIFVEDKEEVQQLEDWRRQYSIISRVDVDWFEEM